MNATGSSLFLQYLFVLLLGDFHDNSAKHHQKAPMHIQSKPGKRLIVMFSFSHTCYDTEVELPQEYHILT